MSAGRNTTTPSPPFSLHLFRQKEACVKHKILILASVLACTLISSQAFSKPTFKPTLKANPRTAQKQTLRDTRLGRAQVVKTKKGEIDLRQDPAQSRQWGLKSIQATKAKAITKRQLKTKRIAIIDTGIDTRHPDLKNKLWHNKGETGKDAMGRSKATNGIDDDKNGYIDDVHGWNFVAHNNDLKDHHGHGTPMPLPPSAPIMPAICVP